MAEEWYAEEGQNGCRKDGREQEVTRDMQGADAVEEDEGGKDVERRLFGHAGEGGKYDLLRVALDHLQYGRALDLALGQQFGEHRRLENAERDITPHADEDEAQEERYAPAPGEELLAGHLAEREHGEVGEEKPTGHAELRQGVDEPARMIGARPLHGHQHRSAPLAADADPLNEAQDGEEDRAPDADALVGRHQRHRESGETHEQQRRDQGRFAADAVAIVAEDRSADRPRHEAHGIDGEGLERSDPRVRIREE